MKEEFIIIEHSIQYKDSGCYPTETYVHVYEVGGGFETKEDAQKFLDQKYADFIVENSTQHSNYKGYRYEKLKKNTWKMTSEYDFWHNDTYTILNFNIIKIYRDE